MLSIYCLFLSFLTPTISFDYYVFSRSWAPTFCAVNKQGICNKNTTIKQQFTIHGLWPTWKNGSWPQYCTGEKLNTSEFDDIIPDLSSHWSDDGNPDPNWWSHEWCKHGTCSQGSSGISNQRDYFLKTLCIDLSLGANTHHLTASINNPYNKTYLQEKLGASLHCSEIAKFGNKSLLSEITVAVSRDFKNIDPLADDGSCSESVYLVPYNYISVSKPF
jgi:ribonuclease T2